VKRRSTVLVAAAVSSARTVASTLLLPAHACACSQLTVQMSPGLEFREFRSYRSLLDDGRSESGACCNLIALTSPKCEVANC
jgi:hypothetical protein